MSNARRGSSGNKGGGSKGADLGSQLERELDEKMRQKTAAQAQEASRRTAPESLPVAAAAGRIPFRQITIFLRQLVLLLESGVPLLRGLTTMSERVQHAGMRRVVREIRNSVEQGNALWQSFARYPRYFTDLFVNLVKAGEASGTLNTVLNRIIDYRDKQDMLRKKMTSAMLYPCVLIVIVLAVVCLFSWKVIPMFEEMYKEFGLKELPGITSVIVTCAALVRKLWWLVLLIIIGLVVVYKIVVKSPEMRLAADKLKLRIPVLGPIIQNEAVAEFASTFGMLFGSGISIMVALDLVKGTIKNKAFAEVLGRVRDSVERGEGIEGPLRRSYDVVPGVVTDMLVTGEESGSLEKISNKIADIYHAEVDLAVDMLPRTLEPIIIVFLGIMILIMAVSLFYPYISMITAAMSAQAG